MTVVSVTFLEGHWEAPRAVVMDEQLQRQTILFLVQNLNMFIRAVYLGIFTWATTGIVTVLGFSLEWPFERLQVFVLAFSCCSSQVFEVLASVCFVSLYPTHYADAYVANGWDEYDRLIWKIKNKNKILLYKTIWRFMKVAIMSIQKKFSQLFMDHDEPRVYE